MFTFYSRCSRLMRFAETACVTLSSRTKQTEKWTLKHENNMHISFCTAYAYKEAIKKTNFSLTRHIDMVKVYWRYSPMFSLKNQSDVMMSDCNADLLLWLMSKVFCMKDCIQPLSQVHLSHCGLFLAEIHQQAKKHNDVDIIVTSK